MGIFLGIVFTLGLVVWTLWRLQESGQTIVNPLRKEKHPAIANPKNKQSPNEEHGIEEEAEEAVIDAYKVKKPWEAVALLIVGISAVDSEISPKLQREIELIFEADFGLTRLEAKSMYETCSTKLEEVDHFIREIPKILEPSVLFFRQNQVQGLPNMLQSIAALDGPPTPRQLAVIAAVQKAFSLA